MPIKPSAALEFNLYTGGSSPVGLDFALNGSSGAYYSIGPGVDLSNGDPMRVDMNYTGNTLFLSIRDTVNNHAYTTSITTDLPATLGSSAAWIGFSGADAP